MQAHRNQMQNWQIKERELPPADKTVQALFKSFVPSQGKALWWAGGTAVFSRSVTYWWKAFLAPLHSSPLAASRESRRPASTEQKWGPGGREQEAFLSLRCDPPLHLLLQEQLWQHLGLSPPFGKVGFSHHAGQGFNWFTWNSSTPAAQVYASQPKQPES